MCEQIWISFLAAGFFIFIFIYYILLLFLICFVYLCFSIEKLLYSDLSWNFKIPLPGLSQFLASETLLKMRKNAFHVALKPLFVLMVM